MVHCAVIGCHMCGDPEYHETFSTVPVFVFCDQAGCGAPRDVIPSKKQPIPLDVPEGCCRYCGCAVEYCGC